ncbi:hypothetical protein GCM10027020_30640 [Nocardioides salsibiostraticola]
MGCARRGALLTLLLTPLLLALLLLALVLPVPPSQASPPVQAAASAVDEEYDPPLTITIDSLNPSYVPRSGILRVTGEVHNADEVDWENINVYSFLGDAPMTTSVEVAQATETDPEQGVGDRIIAAGTEDKIERIAPGESAVFSLAIPRSELDVTEAGVYWFGVHAIGSSATDPRDGTSVADGRARTFLPYVPESTQGSLKTALVIPLRRYLDFAPNGSLADPDAWGKALAPGGRLRAAVDFGAAAGDRPVSWLVDPALPDAVRRLSTGNGGRSLAPTTADPSDLDASTPGPSESSSDPVPEPPPAEPTDAPDLLPPEIEATATDAEAWLNRLDEALADSEVLTLPYGDLDVAAAAEQDPAAYQRARNRPGGVLTSLGIEPNPAIAAPAGYLNPAGFGLVGDETVLVTDEMFGDDVPGVASVDGRRIAVTSSGVAAGGPGPQRPLGVIALRQRLLSEAAVRLLSPGRLPLVVQLPPKWRPAGGADFFNGLDVDWLDLTTVADATARNGSPRDAEDLVYPDSQSRRELDRASFQTATELAQAGASLQNLLTRNDRIGVAVADQALTSLSYGARQAPAKARTAALVSKAWIEGRLRSVEITAPSGVTLTGDSGEFGAIVENKLNQPVTVDIRAVAQDGAITIDPVPPILLAPGARTSVNLTAFSADAGVHNVELMLTDSAGNLLGSSDSLPIRSAQVSGVIWVIMGSGAILLFGAIGVRLFRRVRGERAATRRQAHTPETAAP